MEALTLTRHENLTPRKPRQDVYIVDRQPGAIACRLYPDCGGAGANPAARPLRRAGSLDEVLDWLETAAGPAGEDIALVCPASVIADVAAAAMQAGARRLVLPAAAPETVVRIAAAGIAVLRAHP
jgi:hypothetical protein